MKYSKFMLPGDFKSSFLSCEKDLESILKKLFVESRPYSNDLIRLLKINTKDCLDPNNAAFQSIAVSTTLNDLREEGYIKIEPKLHFGEHESVKSYIVVEFNSFSPTSNPEYRDVVLDFNVICHTDYWDLGDYRLRPIKIMGYIDGILNETKLSGIGTLQFMGANEIVMDEDLSGYLLRYSATHGSDDILPVEE